MDDQIEEINKKIQNTVKNIRPLKGFEIIAESMVYMVYDIFGRNTLLSILYQMGAGPGKTIANRIKEKYGKEQFELFEATEKILRELKEYYAIKIINVEQTEKKVRIEIENHCFLRDPLKHREKLKFGKAFCRVNKGYFEVAYKELLGDSIRNVEINFIRNDPEKDVCIEELIFYL
ncbi:MAG: hypothetical protein EU547_05355 [Promethearchaeota archaeon]|nr:MAG: hypothetical protein EU547_05355 [Candidatus Lokiarchaeota archaeon]